jgi:hypothetical protein
MYLPYELINEILSYSNDLDVKIYFNKEFKLIKKIKQIKNKEKIEFLYKNRYISQSSYCLKNYVISSDINNLELLKDRDDMDNRINMNDFTDITIYDNNEKYIVVIMTFYILKSLDTIVNKKINNTYENMDWVIFTIQYKY